MISRVSVESVVRRLIDSFRRPCQACGRQPMISVADEEFASCVRVDAYCHGSYSIFQVGDFGPSHREASADELVRWLRNLFALDASPDMREVLAYNRGALPERRR